MYGMGIPIRVMIHACDYDTHNFCEQVSTAIVILYRPVLHMTVVKLYIRILQQKS